MKIQYNINLLGWILVLIGSVLLIIGCLGEVSRSNPVAYYFWYDLKTIGERSMSLSVFLIF